MQLIMEQLSEFRALIGELVRWAQLGDFAQLPHNPNDLLALAYGTALYCELRGPDLTTEELEALVAIGGKIRAVNHAIGIRVQNWPFAELQARARKQGEEDNDPTTQ